MRTTIFLLLALGCEHKTSVATDGPVAVTLNGQKNGELLIELVDRGKTPFSSAGCELAFTHGGQRYLVEATAFGDRKILQVDGLDPEWIKTATDLALRVVKVRYAEGPSWYPNAAAKVMPKGSPVTLEASDFLEPSGARLFKITNISPRDISSYAYQIFEKTAKVDETNQPIDLEPGAERHVTLTEKKVGPKARVEMLWVQFDGIEQPSQWTRPD